MALSPKSNSAMLAIDKAIQDLENKNTGNLPLHLKNIYSFDPKQESYKYPHDYPNAWVNQQYLPDPISNAKYDKPKATSKIEKSLKERLEQIENGNKRLVTKEPARRVLFIFPLKYSLFH